MTSSEPVDVPTAGSRARKAVIPAAGLGTRFAPATKAVPKELLPVVDVPALEYIVAEASREGLSDILVVTGRGKGAIEDHFDAAPDIEEALERKGDEHRLARVRRSSELGRLHFVRQREPQGLGDAVSYAEAFVGDESFAVLLGDDIIDERDVLLATMLDVQQEKGGVVLGLIEVEGAAISLYGSIKPAGDVMDGVIAVETLIEKPKPEEALSNLAVIGRYVLPPAIFDALRRTEKGARGELELTDAMRTLAEDGVPIHGVVFPGRRYDTGDRQDYLRAVVRLAVEHPELGADFSSWLVDFVGTLDR
ncbi:UTP--glucose-1-phosphate uridylyltransferase [Jatrophihabitans lederbergiae]|uniref:UTP--glucose-1-phosphate uridylyltransferase n=1 Tax=Jatrophihabitans lederbergiae TaxID=3075547 RepID=A0ABU2JFW4_9ACTN|nr:UTP--glucose-1-phosphate uridylyltransferase [Jatrophihabitans sp. DSM 44399]MDT0263589.1 UTP--glucose-1-phosphate uridylyltransferase [Jatrophihabitans sp. DSM 44399]